MKEFIVYYIWVNGYLTVNKQWNSVSYWSVWIKKKKKSSASSLKVQYVRIFVKTFQDELKSSTECEEMTVLTWLRFRVIKSWEVSNAGSWQVLYKLVESMPAWERAFTKAEGNSEGFFYDYFFQTVIIVICNGKKVLTFKTNAT